MACACSTSRHARPCRCASRRGTAVRTTATASRAPMSRLFAMRWCAPVRLQLSCFQFALSLHFNVSITQPQRVHFVHLPHSQGYAASAADGTGGSQLRGAVHRAGASDERSDNSWCLTWSKLVRTCARGLLTAPPRGRHTWRPTPQTAAAARAPSSCATRRWPTRSCSARSRSSPRRSSAWVRARPRARSGGCCPASWSALPSLILMSRTARPGRAELLGASKGLAVTLADSLLARDKLEAALRCVPRVDCPRCATYQAGASCELAHPAGCRRGEAAERDKRLVGLRRENLTFCGDG